MEPKDNSIKSYRPSRQFIIRGSITFGTIILILIFQTAWFKKLITRHPKSGTDATTNETLGGLVGKDTNGNGIADWEEQLWGLDPTVAYTNGVSNKQIIEQKKKDLGITEEDGSTLTKDDILARQLFTVTGALSQSDQADANAIATIGANIGDATKITKVFNHYSFKDIKTTATTSTSVKTYYKMMSKTMSQYKNETPSIDIIVTAIETGDFSGLTELKKTADIYIDFSKSLQKVTAPVDLADYHLALMNSFYGIADSFKLIMQIEGDGVTGLSGISSYQKYTQNIDSALTNMENYFKDYGII